MKYTNEQRLDIGRRIYDGEISRYEAAEEYGINEQTARNYMRMYQDAKQLPPKREYVLRFAQFTRHDWKILGYFLSQRYHAGCFVHSYIDLCDVPSAP